MQHEPDIDALYRRFCQGLPPDVGEVGRTLAHRLKLAPSPEIPWSAVFSHRVTLQAPVLFTSVVSHAEPELLERAVLAHMLAVIEAFGSDRIADQQVDDRADLRDFLGHARDARNEALSAIDGRRAVALAADADLRTREAIGAERSALLSDAAVGWDTYESISAGKQAVGMPATLAFLGAMRCGEVTREKVRFTLLSVWLGLQFVDDAFDWEDDAARGGAWATKLARKQTERIEGKLSSDEVRASVLSSGVVAALMSASLRKFEAALAVARELGAAELAQWLADRVTETQKFCASERDNPGRLLRIRKLGPWAAEVLS